VTLAIGHRRWVERALHDGVQQDLVAIAVRLQLVRELVTADPVGSLDLLDELGRDVRDALARVQALAAEIYPSILDARGLPDALRAMRAAVRIDAAGVGRYPGEIEAAAYFTCRAVLGDVEHAEAAIGLREERGELLVEIVGGREVGLQTARDLVESVGGQLAVESGIVVATFPV
jgi:hypothetical protein